MTACEKDSPFRGKIDGTDHLRSREPFKCLPTLSFNEHTPSALVSIIVKYDVCIYIYLYLYKYMIYIYIYLYITIIISVIMINIVYCYYLCIKIYCCYHSYYHGNNYYPDHYHYYHYHYYHCHYYIYHYYYISK